MQEVVEAKEFVVRDSTGAIRAKLGTASDGNVALELRAGGDIRAMLLVNDTRSFLLLKGPKGAYDVLVESCESGASVILQNHVNDKVECLSEETGPRALAKEARENYTELLAKISALAELLVAKGIISDQELCRHESKVTRGFDQALAQVDDESLAFAVKEMLARCEQLKSEGRIVEHERLLKVIADYVEKELQKRDELPNQSGDFLDEP